MKVFSKLILFITLMSAFLLAACSGGGAATPAIGQPGQPTLVFIYSDN